MNHKLLFGLVFILLLVPSMAFATTNDAVAYYTFDDADHDGAVLDDVSGTGNDGGVNGTTTGATGKIGEAFDFDGSADFVDIPDALIDADTGTFSAWVKPDNTGGQQYFLGNRESAASNRFYWGHDGLNNWYSRVNSNVASAGGAIASSTWHYVTVTWDNTETKLYINGSSTATITNSQNIGAAAQNDVSIGSYGEGSANWWDGLIDEVAIYDRVLSTAEISELYNSGAGFNPYPAVATGNNESIEQVVYMPDNTSETVNSATYVTVHAETFTPDNTSEAYVQTTLQSVSSKNLNQYCRVLVDGTDYNTETVQTMTPGDYKNIFMFSDPFNLTAGVNVEVDVQCRREFSAGGGTITIDHSDTIVHILHDEHDTDIEHQFMSFNETISSSSWQLLLEGNFTTSTKNASGLIRSIVLDGDIDYNYVSTGTIELYANVDGVNTTVFPQYGTAGTVRSGAGFYIDVNVTNGTLPIKFYGRSTSSDGSVVVNSIVKEFITTENEVKDGDILGTTFSNTAWTTIDSFVIEDVAVVNADLVYLASISTQAITANTSVFYRFNTGSQYSQEYQKDIITSGSRVSILSGAFEGIGIGNHTVNLQTKVLSNSANITGGNTIGYLSNKVDSVSLDYNVTVYNNWTGTPLTNFNVTNEDGTTFSDFGTGVAFVTATHDSANLTIQKSTYVDKIELNHNASTNLNTSMYQTITQVNLTELLTENAVNSFTLETDQGNFATSNGTVVIYPNIGNYSWNATSSGYFDLDQNSFEILSSGAITVENISSSVINITAISALNGSAINTFTITVDSLNFTYTKTQNTTLGYSELPAVNGSYNVSINASGFGLANAIVNVTSTTTNYQFSLYTSESLNINIFDEVTRNSLNGTNITVQIIGATAETYTTTNGSLYVDFLTPFDYELRYFSTNTDVYKLRSTFVSVNVQSAQDINLYLLDTNDTGTTTATIIYQVYDQSLSEVEDAIVIVSRYYPETSSYVDVWSRKTNDQGTATGTFETIDAFYRYRVVYNDEVKYQSSESGVQFSFDDQIDLFIDLETNLYDALQEIEGVTVSDISWNVVSNTSAYYSVTYSSTSSVTVCLTSTARGYLAESLGVHLINVSCETSTGGTLFVYVTGSSVGEISYTAVASVKTSDIIGFIAVKTRTDALGAVEAPTGNDWGYNMAWIAVLLTMISALIYIKNYPRTALLFQGITFIAITASPVQIIPIPLSLGVAFVCLILFVLAKKGGSD